MTEEGSPKPKGTHTPGWNDPPLFAYNSHQSQPKGYSLNKRVAYSLEGNLQQRDSICSTPGKPPPVGPPPLSSSSTSTSKIDSDEIKGTLANKPVELSSVVDNFQSILKEVYADGNEKESNEIKRRLLIMEKMWNEEKFPEAVKQKLYDISEALRENKFDSCDSLQRSLMVDHTSLCSAWMSAIRLLINSKRSSSQ